MTTMKRRLSVDPEYVCALGYAVYAFSYLEWGAVWLAETLKPNYILGELQRRGTSMIGNSQGEAEIPHDLAEGVLPTDKALA
jgi:hypothetical protein